ncbi:MAG: hypothetical protein Q7J04_06070, partial [Microcella sp.]|nr:hypothetical protein [Microcella sp.]
MTGLRRPIATGAALLGVALVAGMLGAATVTLRVARNVVTPPRQRLYDIAVLAVDEAAGTLTLSRTDDTVVPGRYSLWFDGDRGHARVGDIIEHSASSVTRCLDSVQRGDLTRATRARWAGWWY